VSKKEPETTTNSAVVSRFSAKPAWLKLPPKRILVRLGIIIGVLAAVIAAGSWWFLAKDYNHEYQWAKLTHSQPVIFKVGNKAYNKSEVDQLAAYPTTVNRISSSKAYKIVFEDLKVQAAAQAAGVQPNAAEISQALGELGINTAAVLQYTYPNLAAFALAASNVAIRQAAGQYAGYEFIFLFNQHLIPDPLHFVNGYGDAQLIAADRAYAQTQADKYHDLLKTNQITPDEALKEVKNDTKLAYFYIQGTNPSTQFGIGRNYYLQTTNKTDSVSAYITSQTKPGLSDVRIGKSPVGNGAKSVNTETYFYFVILTNAKPASSGNVNTRFQQDTKSLTSKFYGA